MRIALNKITRNGRTAGTGAAVTSLKALYETGGASYAHLEVLQRVIMEENIRRMRKLQRMVMENVPIDRFDSLAGNEKRTSPRRKRAEPYDD